MSPEAWFLQDVQSTDQLQVKVLLAGEVLPIRQHDKAGVLFSTMHGLKILAIVRDHMERVWGMTRWSDKLVASNQQEKDADIPNPNWAVQSVGHRVAIVRVVPGHFLSERAKASKLDHITYQYVP
jgi:hypothetical protein